MLIESKYHSKLVVSNYKNILYIGFEESFFDKLKNIIHSLINCKLIYFVAAILGIIKLFL